MSELKGIAHTVANMLRRDNTPVRNEAAEELLLKVIDVESALSASKAREAVLREKLEAAEALSVTKILLRVEPDLAGHSSEVYARSVAEVVDELGRIDEALETAEEKLRAAEARVKASQEQRPYGYLHMELGRNVPEFHYKENSHEHMLPLFTQPTIPPELAELQRENAELRKLLEGKAPEGKKVVECWGCEGTPAGANDPCEVCGRSSAQPKEPKQ